jgi:hypothetical protein
MLRAKVTRRGTAMVFDRVREGWATEVRNERRVFPQEDIWAILEELERIYTMRYQSN